MDTDGQGALEDGELPGLHGGAQGAAGRRGQQADGRTIARRTHWLEGTSAKKALTIPVPGGIASETEEAQLTELNDWVASLGLPRGEMNYDFADPASGEQQAVFDLAWPNGVQEELSAPVAVLLDEAADMIALASGAGYRCFTSVAAFREYIEKDILALETAA